MWHDRPAQSPVEVNDNVEEMDVQLSLYEIRPLLDPETVASLMSGRFDLQPWVRITDGADLEIAVGIEATPKDDGA